MNEGMLRVKASLALACGIVAFPFGCCLTGHFAATSPWAIFWLGLNFLFPSVAVVLGTGVLRPFQKSRPPISTGTAWMAGTAVVLGVLWFAFVFTQYPGVFAPTVG